MPRFSSAGNGFAPRLGPGGGGRGEALELLELRELLEDELSASGRGSPPELADEVAMPLSETVLSSCGRASALWPLVLELSQLGRFVLELLAAGDIPNNRRI